MDDQQQYSLTTNNSRLKKATEVFHGLKKNWLKIFIVLLVITLLSTVVVTILTPPQPEEQPMPLEPITSGAVDSPIGMTVVFTQIPEELPKTLPIYQATSQINSAENIAASIANQLNIPKDPAPHLNNVWTNYESKEQVSYQPATGKITYNSLVPDVQNPNFNEPFNNDLVIQTAEDFLIKLNQQNLQPDLSSSNYIYEEGSVETSDQAQSIIVPFNFQMNGYPVYYLGSTKSYANIMVNRDYKVIRAEFFPQPPEYQQLENKNVKSLEAAKEEIISGQATILSTSNELGEFDTTGLEQITINNIEIEYRFSPENHLFTPYFRFTGTGNSSRLSAPLNLTLILPAIATTNPI